LPLRFNFAIPAAALAFAGMVVPAHAAERVHLANGFDMGCNHHAQVDGIVRLYPGTGESSYIEMKPEEITGYETVPDPPPPSMPTPVTQRKDAKLTPADLHEMLTEAGEQHNVDADLLASIVKAESDGNARAVSHAGARGLMQLMPKTAAEQGVADSFQPDQNIRGGSAYIDELLQKYHDNIALALAAYNAGPAAVDKYHGIPPFHETRAYVARVIHEFNRRVLARRREQTRQARTQLAQQAASTIDQASSTR
jgi:hypothetical protein